jgi:phosphoribosylformylglycinamidine cyclo-ligase
MEDLYSRLGASSAKEDVHKAIQNLDKGIVPGAFCKVLPDIFGKDPTFLNAMHADGAGTKSILAYLYWRETGDISVWKGIAQDALIMNIDDLICVGAVGDFVVTSTIGRNKRLIPSEVLQAIIEGTEECCEMLRTMGVPTWFAGGETADVGDIVKTILVDSNVTCRFPGKQLIDASRISEGDWIIGIASDGKSTYETNWNSGIASNGITFARHVLLDNQYGYDFPESIDSYLQSKGGYQGKYKLRDRVLQDTADLGKALLSPTRTFAPLIAELVLSGLKPSIHGIIHNTGGGHGKVKNFIGNLSVEKQVVWDVPEIFQLLKAESGIDWPEMFRTFNCGIRMEIYCKESAVEEIEMRAARFGLNTFQIGRVRSSNAPEVKILSGDQVWKY